MGVFEDVVLNARTAVDSMGKKAGQVIDLSKLRIAALDLKSEISQKYSILGRIAYEESVSGKSYEKSKAELIEKITELKAQLASVNEMLEIARQKTKCPSCGTYNAKGAVFCAKCGAKVNPDQTAAEHMSPDDVIDFTEDNFEDDDLL